MEVVIVVGVVVAVLVLVPVLGRRGGGAATAETLTKCQEHQFSRESGSLTDLDTGLWASRAASFDVIKHLI